MSNLNNEYLFEKRKETEREKKKVILTSFRYIYNEYREREKNNNKKIDKYFSLYI